MDQLRNARGQEAVLTIRKYERELHKLESLKNRISFLQECLDNKVIPKSFKSMENASGMPFEKLQKLSIENVMSFRKQEKELVYAQCRQAFRDVNFLGFDYLVNSALDNVRRSVKCSSEKQKVNLEKKLEDVFSNSQWIRFSQINNVINLSNRLLSRDEIYALGFGLNFCLGNNDKLTIDFNSQINDLNANGHDELSTFLRGAFSVCDKNLDCFPKKFTIAMKRLRYYKDIRVMKADKGNAIVVMNSSEYTSKMEGLLSDRNVYKVLETPCDIKKWQTNFNNSLKSIIFQADKEVYNSCLSPKLPILPHIYGLPKVHKDNCPLRPIVSSLKAPNKNLSLYLAKILGSQVGLVSDAHIKKTTDFLEFIKNDVKEPFDHMVSFDVVSLFTNVPLNKVLDFIRLKTEENVYQFELEVGKICELIILCVKDTYFTFNGIHYCQTYGVAMGSSLSPILANLYMEFFETSLLPNIHIDGLRIICYKRYVDDTFALIKGKEFHKVEELLHLMNSQEESIKFTLENSENMEMPFLDLQVKFTNSGFKTRVHRKSTHSNSYIHFFSNHSSQVKQGVLVGLFLRALRYCEPEFLDDEIKYIFESFEKLGYPHHFINKALSKSRRIFYNNGERRNWNANKDKIVKLPYVPEFEEKIVSKLDNCGYKFVFSYEDTIRKSLCKNKLEPSLQRQNYEGPGVYLIDCNKCSLSYVGETGRNLETRKKEHGRDIRNWNVNSAIANHCWNEDNHRMDFDNSKIVYKSNNIKIRRLIEGALIDSIPTIAGNKSFSKVDPINLKTIVKEARLAGLVKQKKDSYNPNLPETIIPQNNLPNPPGNDPRPPIEERGFGTGLAIINGQHLRRSHRLNASQYFDNGDRGH